MLHIQQRSTLFPYTTLFRSARAACRTTTRSSRRGRCSPRRVRGRRRKRRSRGRRAPPPLPPSDRAPRRATRSEEHTSELQSRLHLVCRLLLEKKKKLNINSI